MENISYILEMKNITKLFPAVRALDAVNLSIEPGKVHALMGENGAGKSTLMKCLFGMYGDNYLGDIYFDGQKIKPKNTWEALSMGITMIHQELQPEPFLSVMENIWLGRIPTKKIGPLKFVNKKKMYNDSKKYLDNFNINIDPKLNAGELSVSMLQAVEIIKAVTYNAKIIIMDEPTSSLTEHEVEHLFSIIRHLTRDGVAVIYISHKMEEILDIADNVSIMRDGQMIGTWPSRDLTTDLMISRMVGRDLSQRYPEINHDLGDTMLEISELTSANLHSFKNVSFSVRKGEILGIGGLVGAQRTELIEGIFGIHPISSGKIIVEGTEVKIKNPANALNHGLALLTEDRRQTGIFPVLSVEENIVIAGYKNFKNKFGLIESRKVSEEAKRVSTPLRVKTPSMRTPISNLSGGNQQKVLLSRWLLTDPKILMMDEPTRGIDVGAKFDIYTIITDLAAAGKTVVFVSSETSELIGLSDRILIMSDGKKAGELIGEEKTEENIMRLATKYLV